MANWLDWWERSVEASIRRGGISLGKRFDAMCEFQKRMSHSEEVNGELVSNEEILAAMPSVFVWAPPMQLSGRAMPPNIAEGFEAVIYLNPILEFESQAYVNHTVAHEFAHVWLRHHVGEGSVNEAKAGIEHKDQQHEKDADELAAKWGFAPREKKNGTGTWLWKAVVQHGKSLKSKPRLFKKFIEAATQ